MNNSAKINILVQNLPQSLSPFQLCCIKDYNEAISLIIVHHNTASLCLHIYAKDQMLDDYFHQVIRLLDDEITHYMQTVSQGSEGLQVEIPGLHDQQGQLHQLPPRLGFLVLSEHKHGTHNNWEENGFSWKQHIVMRYPCCNAIFFFLFLQRLTLKEAVKICSQWM